MSFPSTRTEQSTLLDSLRAALQNRAVFFASITVIYAAAIIGATLTLNAYFSQTWDVQTFIQAGKQFLDGRNPLALYAESRTAQTWPYAYPPLHAFFTAIVLALGNLFRILPDYVWARVPTITADIGIAFLLHSIVRRKTNDEPMARAAALLWLFNPITFYNTAVQGHFESEWLVFVLLAYAWLDEGRTIVLPTIALAIAVLFKQVAVIFVIPIWLFMLLRTHSSSLKQFTLSGIIFAVVIAAVCLPFLLYSSDFLYMNLTYVENVPVQTQSWIVALLGLTRNATTDMTTNYFLLRYQTFVTMLAAVAISYFGARRGWSLYLTAMLIALAFFLTSKKVMGYYYVMLVPFLLAEFMPRKRFDLVTPTLVAMTFISLSPYYAAWTNQTHWWVYAVLGIINSTFFVWLFVKSTDDRRPTTDAPSPTSSTRSARSESAQDAHGSLRLAVIVSLGLFAAALFASLLQPFAPDNGSPIRAPIITPGMEVYTLALLGLLSALIVVAMFIAYRATRTIGGDLRWGVWSVPLVFAPLFFSVYTLTKESTAIFEIALKALGV